MNFQINDEILITAKYFLEEVLKENKGRIAHSHRCADTAYELALQVKYDPKSAYFAALLHDVGKNADPEFAHSKFCEYKIEDPFILKDTELGHGALSAILSYEKFKDYGLEYDSDILQAMRYHTFGRDHMSLLEKIVYVADLIEPGRNYPNADILRTKVKNNFHEGIYQLCADNLKFLISKRIIIHPNAVIMLNSLTKNTFS